MITVWIPKVIKYMYIDIPSNITQFVQLEEKISKGNKIKNITWGLQYIDKFSLER